jgi:Membrane domain of glycerophosphoryl diester phosphodiesterase
MPKLSLSVAWDEAKAVLARDGRLFLAVALALFVLPGLILNVTMPVAEPGKFPPAGSWMGVALVAGLISLVGQLAVLRLAMEPHVAVGEAIVHGLKRLLPYVAATLCWLAPILIAGTLLYGILEANQAKPSVVAALALIALCVLFAFLAVRLMLSSPVASAENIGPIAILQRSWQLSRGNWWRLFAFLLLFGIAALCLLLAVESVATLLVRTFAADAGPRSVGGLLISIISQMVSAFLSVTFFVLLARIYVQRSGTGAAQASVPSSGI